MKKLSSLFAAVALTAPLSLVGCAADGGDDSAYDDQGIKEDGDDKADASAVATFIELSWSGSFVTDWSFSTEQTVRDHLLYTIGQLNGLNSVGRLDHLKLSNLKSEYVNGKYLISYDAVLPVAFGRRTNVPNTIKLDLPADMGFEAITAFTNKYKHDCVDFGAHDVDSGSMWYYFRPAASGCEFAPGDINTFEATVSPSSQQTTGKFPEYQKIWEDKQFNTVAIFGKYEDGATSSGDAGIAAWNSFINNAKRTLAAFGTVTTTPANLPDSPGVSVTDVEIKVAMANGRSINVTALLSDNVRVGLQNPAFKARYEAASTRADFITYNGHAGLGANVRALSRAGKWTAGQYVISFENGCDTYAYIDDEMRRAHQAVNPDDTTGYKYLDTLANAMPAFFSNMSSSSLTIMKALINDAAPQTYEQIFRGISSSQVILVTGEQDNTFVPGGGGTPEPWAGMRETGSVARYKTKSWTTPVLAAGKYSFNMTGTKDADLYIRIGSAPTTTLFDCRPHLSGSTESCLVTLPAPAKIGVMVRGAVTGKSTFTLVGKQVP